MGKHVKKSKATGDIPVMEAGVLTRAQTLALHNLPPPQPERNQSNGSDYLQLRSRRLQKLPPPRPKSKLSVATSAADLGMETEEGYYRNIRCDSEGSFGENDLEFETRDRSTRESTPCSLIRNSDSIITPGSTTRRSGSVANNPSIRNDIDEFFAQVQRQQQELFIEKYNFDIANDTPLAGRYEWEQVVR